PWVEQLESGRRLDFDLSYDAGRYTALDSKRRSVLLDRLASRAYTMSGRWFNLPPGPSTIRCGGTSTQGQARAFVRWRDTHLYGANLHGNVCTRAMRVAERARRQHPRQRWAPAYGRQYGVCRDDQQGRWCPQRGQVHQRWRRAYGRQWI